MIKNKKILLPMIALLAVIALLYLAASFIHLSFNPGDWHIATRVVFALSFAALTFLEIREI